MKRYYLGGKQYIPEKSVLLCSHVEALTTTTLYRTKKGTFFLVQESVYDGDTAQVIDQKTAFTFMDKYPAGIHTDAYDSVFGQPDEG